VSATAQAQQPTDPNAGNITLTAGIDFPSKYLFRGIAQESDSELTTQPYGDVGLALFSGGGAVKSVGVNFGLWNSLHTGSSGSDGPGKVWYEEDFYAGFTLGFARATSVATTYTAYTSPNAMFGTVREINFKVSMANRIAPYGILAFEVDGQADGGSNEGTYLELGIGPNWPLGGNVTVTIPVKLGLSLNDYYENPSTGEDDSFGFFDIGALFTLPLSFVPSRFGSWNIHGGLDVFTFGDTTKEFNPGGDRSRVIYSGGLGLTY
jgi:Bacterial protein of unknown function (Gcw_chp)